MFNDMLRYCKANLVGSLLNGTMTKAPMQAKLLARHSNKVLQNQFYSINMPKNFLLQNAFGMKKSPSDTNLYVV
jgi:hypothetical protein